MAVEYVKVTEFVRGVVNGKVVVRRPGARIPLELAVALGIEHAPAAAPVARTARQQTSTKPRKPPRRPAGATPPRARKTGRR